jgi:hypothetical protein
MTANAKVYHRREVLALAAAGVAVACLPFASLATPALGAPRVEPLADWSIDDQWGIVPRWDAIPCAPQQSDDARLAVVHPADAPFLV